MKGRGAVLAAWPLAVALLAGAPSPAAAQEKGETLRLEVVEVARAVDLARGREEFLTLAVEISGPDPLRLRRVQPLRDDFQLSAGKASLPCRWLRGGSLPEDPSRLRFTLGFTLPPPTVKSVRLRASLPRPAEPPLLEVRLTGLAAGKRAQERSGRGWALSVHQFSAAPYVPPALPPRGHYFSKGGPVDNRVFQKAAASAPAPERALVLAFHSDDPALYDATVDVDGTLLLDSGAPLPLLSASMRRDPSRSVQKPPYPPFVQGEFQFPVPSRGRPTGAVLRFHRRPAAGSRLDVVSDALPVPGR